MDAPPPAEGREARGHLRRSEQARTVHDPPADADGYKIAPHTHPTDEHVTVLSGCSRAAMGTPGTKRLSVISRQAVTRTWPRRWRTIGGQGSHRVQVHGVGPFVVNYVNPADDPSGRSSRVHEEQVALSIACSSNSRSIGRPASTARAFIRSTAERRGRLRPPPRRRRDRATTTRTASRPGTARCTGANSDRQPSTVSFGSSSRSQLELRRMTSGGSAAERRQGFACVEAFENLETGNGDGPSTISIGPVLEQQRRGRRAIVRQRDVHAALIEQAHIRKVRARRRLDVVNRAARAPSFEEDAMGVVARARGCACNRLFGSTALESARPAIGRPRAARIPLWRQA